jgi:BA14K-like protein
VYGPKYGVGVGAAAVATGALIGGAIATQNQGYYYPDQNYPCYLDPGYVYSDAAPVAYNNGDFVAYCEQTFRSYDQASGSYLGYDGFRHACP